MRIPIYTLITRVKGCIWWLKHRTLQARICSDGRCLALMGVFSLSFLGPQTVSMDKNPWLWSDRACSFPRTRGSELFWLFLVQHCLTEGEIRGGWHGPKPMAVPPKPQKELCDCDAGFGAIHRHNARFYLSILNRNRRVCFSQQ